MSQFPLERLRRTRASAWSRAMHRETAISPADLIWPLFVTDGHGVEEPIASLPGVSRASVDIIAQQAQRAVDLGISCVALFANTPHALRDETGSEALNPGNLMCRAIAGIKERCGDALGVLTDVALDPYTSHGQDGVLDRDGYVVNDATVDLLVGQALVQARAGADIIAPSDMMDGRVAAIRSALEEQDRPNVQIMAYSAKYASAFYGPFRDAVGSAGLLKGNKKTYQMDPANGAEALREAAADVSEGADSIMVKPGVAYLDIVYRLQQSLHVPVFVYHTSGEYAMIEAAAAAGAGDRDAMIMETMIAFKRAGATGVLTYHAPVVAELLHAR
ncbi:porphobilinogen synthase [Croceicoccus sp. F390]|uniref:Delta-aminolevulinic acid dehydratase n=1 Tax=Croceicoccus esteveae TaxID=3075597 RepID=A0ABU2ZKW6_9SPHN|nr:porphobilinogen synthase [Croceicoccus sp. F390]MDT0576224.1 porphobilinogen synthase [Croceicoccus sp. F390]